ncbi:hypothetical protein [Ralstonia phage RP31]|uniref:Uncharacterized protein n=2 Tax=Ripduovirus RP12 TaxID=2560700 RepID=A0A1L7N0S8_9CAUD|nr:hypothetical protein FDH28_gp099 [Ralstonia phage RP12]BAW19073.1 hypothetical protein [Ralstonia phage RP12]BAW19358.1 hypothetical protein [Ralstonia phage RP31]
MKKLFAVLILAAISTQSFAMRNSMCEAKQDQREYDNCYNLAINGGMTRMKGNYSRIMSSSNVPQNEKDVIPKFHKKWLKEVEKQCGNDSVCFYDNLSDRNMEIERYMVKYNLTPM